MVMTIHIGMGPGPIPIEDWRVVRADRDELVFQPAGITLWRRFGLSLVCVVFAGLFSIVAQPHGGWPAAMRGLPPPSDLDGLDRAILAIAGLLVGGAVLAPLSVLWNRVRLTRMGSGAIAVRVVGLWPWTYRFEAGAFQTVQFGFEEVVHRGRRRNIGEHYWRWFVALSPAAPEGRFLRFHVRRDKQRPGAQPRPPEAVRTLVVWLADACGGLPVMGPIVNEEAGPASVWTGRRERNISYDPEVTIDGQPAGRLGALSPQMREHVLDAVQQGGVTHRTESHTYRSLDEMPPHLRKMAAEMMGQGPAGGHGPQGYYYTDSSGRRCHYASFDDMPPEVRREFERMLGSR